MSSSVAGKTAVLQNIHGTMEFLRKYPPFNQMDSAQLAYLVEHCQLRFYAAGESIIKPGDGPVQHFYIVKQGLVVGERPHSARRGSETTFEIASGECFPLAALLGERATRTEHLAGEDTFCLLLGKDAFVRLFAQSAPFRDFALRGVSQPARPGQPAGPAARRRESRCAVLAGHHPARAGPAAAGDLQRRHAAARYRAAHARAACWQHRDRRRGASAPPASSPCATCAGWWPTVNRWSNRSAH